MTEEIINNFLKYGFLKEIKLGISLEKALEILDTSSNKTFLESRKRIGLELDDISLSFFKNILDVIKVNVKENRIKLPSAIMESDITLKSDLEDLSHCLTNKNIKFDIDRRFSNSTITCLTLNSEISDKNYSEMLLYFNNGQLYRIVIT